MKRRNILIVILLFNLVAYSIIREFNSALAMLSVHLTLDAIFLLFPALYLPLFDGLVIVVLTALMTDAWLPIPYGTSLCLYLIAYGLARQEHFRLRREKKLHVIYLAVIINAGIMLALTALMTFPNPANLAYWMRNFLDILLSLLGLVFLAGWWVNIQRTVLIYFGTDIAAELPAD